MVLIEHELKNAYIWEYNKLADWLIAYYPLNSDWKDHKSELWAVWTTYDCSMSGSFSYNFTTWKVNNCLNKTTTPWDLDTGITLGTTYSLMFWMNMTQDWWWNLYAGNKATDTSVWFAVQFYYKKPWIKVYWSHYYADNDITANTWYHYALTQNWTTATLYVNWVWKTFTIDWTAWESTLKILWLYDSWYLQMMDEVYVYNRVLSSDEILDYYNNTK